MPLGPSQQGQTQKMSEAGISDLSPGIWQVKELGADLSELGELYGIEPPNNEGLVKSVKEDVEKLKASPFINPSIDLYGFVYDTLSGKLEEVVSYTPQS